MARLKLARPIKPRGKVTRTTLVTGLLTRPTKGRKKRFKCMGGPFDGKTIALWDEMPGNTGTMEFSIPSYNNGERGLYKPDAELADCVTWRTV